MITHLLERDPLMRLGTEQGAAELKAAAFFEGLDWCNLLRIKAAFVPQLEHDEDCSYFDTRSDRYNHEVGDDEDMDYADILLMPGTSASSVISGSSTSLQAVGGAMEATDTTGLEEVDSTLTAADGRLTAERLHTAISRCDSPLAESMVTDEELFHAFASCTPRFSIAMERATFEGQFSVSRSGETDGVEEEEEVEEAVIIDDVDTEEQQVQMNLEETSVVDRQENVSTRAEMTTTVDYPEQVCVLLGVFHSVVLPSKAIGNKINV